MLTKSILQLHTKVLFSQIIGIRHFAEKTYQGQMSDNFKFPQHKEYFNDHYYEQADNDPNSTTYTKGDAKPDSNPFTQGKDYIDANEPFVEESDFLPGGILATYKKRLNRTTQDIMEQDYWNSVKDLSASATDCMNTISKNEKELMINTKNFT